MQVELVNMRQRDKRTLLIMLAIAAALPLLAGGAFAGAALALIVSIWLWKSAHRVENGNILTWVALAVLAENVVFIAGFFGLFD